MFNSGTYLVLLVSTLEALKVGNTVFQANSNAVSFESVPNGTLVGFAGSLRSTKGLSYKSAQAALIGTGTSLTVTNAGIGYTPLGNSVPRWRNIYTADFVNVPLLQV